VPVDPDSAPQVYPRHLHQHAKMDWDTKLLWATVVAMSAILSVMVGAMLYMLYDISDRVQSIQQVLHESK
jgi:predicted ATPase